MKWIRACIFNSSMSVLINGSPTEEFTVGKGLRQGDPLSPFLFLIAAEGLTGMFADDTILMGDCSWDNVRTMKSILRGFELVSGLKINFVKSKLYGINVESSVLAAAATFLDCSYMTLFPLNSWAFRYGPLSFKLLSWEAVETGSKDSIWWRDVVGIGGKGADCWFPSHVSSVLGNGNSISFLKEKWNGAVPLRDLFPNLYEKVLFKNSVVSDLIQTANSELNWNRDWLLSLSQDALVEKADPEQLLFGLVLHSNIEDRWRWKSDLTGLFSVKSVYNFLQLRLESSYIEPDLLAAINKLWKNDIPSKVGVFGWRLLLEKLPTRAALASKGGWKHFLHYGSLVKNKKGMKVRHLIWLATTWCLWRMKNNILFRDENADFAVVFDQIKFISWL
ncbi:hypothetical protein TSUD_334420 [Trifolium subterraneum]|uniref:Reverse transcriptase zinc-binding domain-containing protein n=1 Tax=Trifolium subterraneum TaxID=3900 RepID=A0A2Z6LUW3_TRISU|nr:hypothetical protein TSUD_334420 [Trifolium subterraneum]